MPSVSLSINGRPMCGVVGEVGAQGKFCTWDLWLSYVRHFRKDIAEDRPVTPLPEFAVWRFCGVVIPEPDGVMLTMEI